MRHFFTWLGCGLAGCLLFSTVALAGGRNLADYPLRVHLYHLSQHSHYRYQMIDYVDGEGSGNLYEKGNPRGFDYGFRCDDRLMLSQGWETYPARWRKAEKELEILLPVMGKPDSSRVCGLKVTMKEMAYFRHGSVVEEEPAAVLKQWMEKHQYDPEHGKDQPVTIQAAPGSATNTPQ